MRPLPRDKFVDFHWNILRRVRVLGKLVALCVALQGWRFIQMSLHNAIEVEYVCVHKLFLAIATIRDFESMLSTRARVYIRTASKIERLSEVLSWLEQSRQGESEREQYYDIETLHRVPGSGMVRLW